MPPLDRPLPISMAVVRRTPPPAVAVQAEEQDIPAEVYNPPPDYPSQARRRGLEGEALIEITIFADGTCGEARLLDCRGSPLFGEAALEAVRKWKFRPAARNGQAVASTQSIRFLFRLRA